MGHIRGYVQRGCPVHTDHAPEILPGGDRGIIILGNKNVVAFLETFSYSI